MHVRGYDQHKACDAVLMVSSRAKNNIVYIDLKLRKADWADTGVKSVKLIGDTNASGPIDWATDADHRYARGRDGNDAGDSLSFRREITQLAVV